MLPYVRTWFDAWVDAAYGAQGFWTQQTPEKHFRTSSTTGGALARLLAGLLDQHREIEAVIDVGAGGGELLIGLRQLRPDLILTGVDRRPRPGALLTSIGWAEDHWDVRRHAWSAGVVADWLTAVSAPTLVVASEWLDDLPCPVAAYGSDGWQEVLVDRQGAEQPGAPLAGAELQWAERWWPEGPRAEIGSTRDRAWAELVGATRAHGGSALLIDYGHHRAHRPHAGSLAAYSGGHQVRPAPSPAVNLTAHLAVDAARAAGEAAGGRTLCCRPQAELVDQLWPPAEQPDPLVDLVERGRRAALASPAVWGSQWWLWQA